MPVYANEKTFTTRPVSENMIMDIDGNIYKTIQIGDQTWMAENLKVWVCGFNALPGGYRHGSAMFMDLGTAVRFWSSSGRGYC